MRETVNDLTASLLWMSIPFGIIIGEHLMVTITLLAIIHLDLDKIINKKEND